MKAIILAGGKGVRLGDMQTPKALRLLAGQPLIRHALHTSAALAPPQDTVVVLGYMGQAVQEYLGPSYAYAWQEQQLGTGHAARCAETALQGYSGPVYVSYGDVPLIRRSTVLAMAAALQDNAAVVLTAIVPPGREVPPYGRIIRKADGSLDRIVEVKNATPEEMAIREVNVGPVMFTAPLVWQALAQITDRNAQHEYLLTDAPGILVGMGQRVVLWDKAIPDELLGVNTPQDLAECEAILQAGGEQ